MGGWIAAIISLVQLAACSPRQSTPPPKALPNDPCQILSKEQVSNATDLAIVGSRGVPGMGKSVRSQQEGREPSADFCIYSTASGSPAAMISVPRVDDPNFGSYRKYRQEYARAFKVQSVKGIGQDAWIRGNFIAVLVGHDRYFTAELQENFTKERLLSLARSAWTEL